jgi:chromosome segregation ATPase
MNLEKMSMLSQKIEGVLGTVRALKEENAKIKRELSQAQAMVQDKTLLLESAKHDLADCKAALDARANQANAQQDMLNRQTTQMEALNEKTVVLGQQLVEKDGCIESLESKVRELTSNQELLSGQINERAETVSALNAQVAEKDATIAKLMEQLSEKNALVDSLNEQLQAQNEEIAEAQEKFNQLVATIERELGTDISLDSNEPVAEEIAEEPAAEESVAEESAEAEKSDDDLVFEDVTAENSEAEESVEEPQVDESVSQEQEAEEDVPTIEVHGADENDNDLFASKQEGSQTNFFG